MVDINKLNQLKEKRNSLALDLNKAKKDKTNTSDIFQEIQKISTEITDLEKELSPIFR